jgi:hypothetical protein
LKDAQSISPGLSHLFDGLSVNQMENAKEF